MNSNDPVWYVNTSQGRAGPYSLNQLQGFFKTGQLPPQTLVTADVLGGKTVEISTLFPPAQTGKTLPPRPPQDPMQADLHTVPVNTSDSDPALTLFDTLQAAKDRKANAAAQTAPLPSDEPPRERRPIPKQVWYAVAGGLAFFAVAGWALMSWLGSAKESHTPVEAKSSITTSTSPALPSTPNGAPAAQPTQRTALPPPATMPRYEPPSPPANAHAGESDGRDVREDEPPAQDAPTAPPQPPASAQDAADPAQAAPPPPPPPAQVE